MKILVCVETRASEVEPASRELLSAARALAEAGQGSVEALTLGAKPSLVGPNLSSADVLVSVTGTYTPEAYGAAVLEAVRRRKPDIVLAGYTPLGLDIAPALALRAGMALVGYCAELALADSAVEASSQIYGGKLRARTRTPLPVVCVVTPGAYPEAASGDAFLGEVVEMALPASPEEPRMRIESETAPDASGVDLTKAERILCVGRGIGERDNIAAAAAVASLLGAELAGSRPVVDSGWLPKARQVGKSGQKVKPKLYLCLGVSGAPEHIEGMKGSELIIAVNSDAKAPIFDVAHYGTTCDLLELLPSLEEILKAGA